MALQRKEYPAMLDSLQPGQAVAVVQDRLKHVTRLNSEIADWIQDRVRLEEQYAQGLRKLAQKHLLEDSSALGVFSVPWQKLTASAEGLADAHRSFATKIASDVEAPLRDFPSANKEMQAMPNMSGNLQALAKELENAQRKAEKLQGKGQKAAASKVANAASEVDNATQQWESQAPYVFEALQAVDESRLNHLRDLLTQYETHEMDLVERNRNTVEQCLNVILNIETADEIKTFALKTAGSTPKVERQASRNGPGPSGLAPPTPTPPSHGDDGSSQRSGSVQEQKHSSSFGGGLKRLGTVLNPRSRQNRRQSLHPYSSHSLTPDNKSSSNLGGFSPFKKDKARELHSSSGPSSPPRRLSEQDRGTPRLSDASSPPPTGTSLERSNGTLLEEPDEITAVAGLANGSHEPPALPEPLQPSSPSSQPVAPSSPIRDINTPLSTTASENKDSEGYSVPPPARDAISQALAEAEAAGASENHTQQFKVDIRSEAIKEEDGDAAENALASVANTLRASVVPPRKSGTVRGRRDVRHSVFVPNQLTPDLTGTSAASSSTSASTLMPAPLLPQPVAQPISISPTTAVSNPPLPPPVTQPATSPAVTPSTAAEQPLPASPPSIPQSPVRFPGRLLGEEHAASDTQSIRSGRSLTSTTSTTIKHPALQSPGLNSSIVEVISATQEGSRVTRAMIIGQVALAFNPTDLSSGPIGTDTIRLTNFPVLEKVAPNPAFVEQISGQLGNYTIDLSKISRTSVGFHYQVHLDNEAEDGAKHVPLLLSHQSKVEPTQTSVIVHYSVNPAWLEANAEALAKADPRPSLSNIVLIVRLDAHPAGPARAKSCLSKPVGSFSREKGMVYWRLPDIPLDASGAEQQTLRARFITEGAQDVGGIRVASAEAKWEVALSRLDVPLGSGLGVERLDGVEEVEKDPFADEGEEEEEGKEDGSPERKERWEVVGGVRKLVAGAQFVAH